jgi:HAD superfamily hydrolase (TIGR01490 family)
LGSGESSKIAAIFDLDGTLYTGHVTLGIAQHHRTNHVNLRQLYTYLAIHMPIWWIQRLGLISEITSRSIWTRNLGWTVQGLTCEEAEQAFAWLAEQYVLPQVRSDVINRLRDHQAAGHTVILVSGTFYPLLHEIGRRLDVVDTVGTPMITKAGRYTGASELPVCQGVHKVTRLEEYLDGRADILWSDSYAYADSYSDLPLLERVGHPVAVFPDSRLSDHALRHGWEIIE